MHPPIPHPTCEVLFADHAARIVKLEEGQREEKQDRKELNEKVDGLKNWIMATLAAALIGLLTQVLMHVLK